MRLLLSCLILMGFASLASADKSTRQRATRPTAAAGQNAPSAPARPSPVVFSVRAKSDERSSEDAAKQEARERARKWLSRFLDGLSPYSHWSPSSSYIERKLLVEQPKVSAVDKRVGPDESVTMYVATAELSVSEHAWREMLRIVRHDEARQRQWFLAKGLLALLAFLGSTAAYYRLDDFTKGYYTRWLQVGAVTTVVLSLTGISYLP